MVLGASAAPDARPRETGTAVAEEQEQHQGALPSTGTSPALFDPSHSVTVLDAGADPLTADPRLQQFVAQILSGTDQEKVKGLRAIEGAFQLKDSNQSAHDIIPFLYGNEALVKQLEASALNPSTNPEVRGHSIACLGLVSTNVPASILSLTENESPEVRIQAYAALGELAGAHPEARTALSNVLHDSDPRVKMFGINLYTQGDSTLREGVEIAPALIDIVNDKSLDAAIPVIGDVRSQAALLLPQLNDPQLEKSAPAVRELFHERSEACAGLPENAPEGVRDQAHTSRLISAWSLMYLGRDAEASQAIMDAAQHSPVEKVRALATAALPDIGGDAAKAVVTQNLNDPSQAVQAASKAAAAKMGIEAPAETSPTEESSLPSLDTVPGISGEELSVLHGDTFNTQRERSLKGTVALEQGSDGKPELQVTAADAALGAYREKLDLPPGIEVSLADLGNGTPVIVLHATQGKFSGTVEGHGTHESQNMYITIDGSSNFQSNTAHLGYSIVGGNGVVSSGGTSVMECVYDRYTANQ